jgi:hypothetical protein
MEQEDKVLLGEFGLAIGGALVGVIVSITIEQSFVKYPLIFLSVFCLFILYMSLIGRPWPRSYNRIISCEGTDEDVNTFFWMYYYDFEEKIGNRLYSLFNVGLPKKAISYLTVEDNKIKIESEDKDWLDVVNSLTIKIIDSLRIEKIKVSDVNFQNALSIRLIKNTQFRTSYTKIHFIAKIDLNEINVQGIHDATSAMGLQSEGENATTYFSWPDEKDFSYVKPSKKGLRNILRYYHNVFLKPDISYNFPFIRKHMITLDQYEQILTYSVTIDAKWDVPLTNINVFYKDAIDEFSTFLSLWDEIDKKVSVKHRFKDTTFLGLIIKDGIDATNFAKKMTIMKKNMMDVE